MTNANQNLIAIDEFAFEWYFNREYQRIDHYWFEGARVPVKREVCVEFIQGSGNRFRRITTEWTLINHPTFQEVEIIEAMRNNATGQFVFIRVE